MFSQFLFYFPFMIILNFNFLGILTLITFMIILVHLSQFLNFKFLTIEFMSYLNFKTTSLPLIISIAKNHQCLFKAIILRFAIIPQNTLIIHLYL